MPWLDRRYPEGIGPGRSQTLICFFILVLSGPFQNEKTYGDQEFLLDALDVAAAAGGKPGQKPLPCGDFPAGVTVSSAFAEDRRLEAPPR